VPGTLAFATTAGVITARIIASAGVRRRKQKLAELAAIAEVTQRAAMLLICGS
jgi:hypothetical protein